MATPLIVASILAVVVICIIMLQTIRGHQSVAGGSTLSRLQRWQNDVTSETSVVEAIKGERYVHLRQMFISALNRSIENRSFTNRLKGRLSRADVALTPGEFLIVVSISTILGASFLWLFFPSFALLTIVGALGGCVMPFWYLRIRHKKRLKKFQSQLADASAMLASSLRTGYSIIQSMEVVSREMPAPIGEEFQRLTREIGLGLSPEQALANLVKRINSADVELMVASINVQREVGGNLSEILDIITETIRERVTLQGEIRTLTAQQTMAGYVITGLPIALFVFLYLLDPKYMGVFYYFGPHDWQPWGAIMGGVTIFMMGLGYFVMSKITNIEA